MAPMWTPSYPLARPRRSALAVRLPPDLLAVAALLGLTVAGAWDLLRRGGTTVGLDAVAFFYPMFSFLGERLRAGDLPGWNPYQFAGAPFAADPESGWMYLPAMLLFALLPLATAAAAFSLFHLLLAGIGTYALARVLGLGPLGALAAAVAFEFSGFFGDRVRCCFAHVQVAAWLPLLLLGAELAIRSHSWQARLGWWSLSGFALSQVLAAWLGQGAYYVLLLLAGYVLYRAAVAPPAVAADPAGGSVTRDRDRSTPVASGLAVFCHRLARSLLHGGAILLIGFLLAAAGILPRLEYHARSNLADGYAGNPNLAWAAELGGWSWDRAGRLLLDRTGWYVGGATLALALVAPVLVRRRHAVPFFVAIVLTGLSLAIEPPTLLNRAFSALLPRFADLHRHRPERVLDVCYLPLALLAGATVDALPRWRERPARLALVAALPAVVAAALSLGGSPIAAPGRVALVAVCLSLAAVAVAPRDVARLVPPLLVLLLFVDLVAATRANVARGDFATVDLARYGDPTGAAAFLRARPNQPPFRFAGYDPALRSDRDGQVVLYRHEFDDPRASALLVNNRATLLRLPDVQGYNPIQSRRYVDFIAAMNGRPQEYHGAYLLADGLDSPLLDLLNTRYLVLPTRIPPDRADLLTLATTHPAVYRDDAVRVVENRQALPRAWLVHEARRVDPGEALPLLAAGAIDPRQTALLETDPPPLAPATDPDADRADVVDHEPDRMRLRTRTDAPGLLVLSETYDPAWHAYVDGNATPLLVADHALRAVPVPAGEHAVELRYESRALRVGLAISGAGYAGIGGLGMFFARRSARRLGRRAIG